MKTVKLKAACFESWSNRGSQQTDTTFTEEDQDLVCFGFLPEHERNIGVYYVKVREIMIGSIKFDVSKGSVSDEIPPVFLKP